MRKVNLFRGGSGASLAYMINDMIVPGSSYGNVALTREAGAVLEGHEALATVDRFADDLAWLAEKTKA